MHISYRLLSGNINASYLIKSLVVWRRMWYIFSNISGDSNVCIPVCYVLMGEVVEVESSSSEGTTIFLYVEHSAPERRDRVRCSLGETPPCMLKAPGACRWCNVPQVPIQFYTSESIKAREPSSLLRIKIVMTCHQTILRDESQNVGNSSLRYSGPTLNTTCLS